jgi:hypothetical protein
MDETTPKNRGRYVHFVEKIWNALSVPNGDALSRGRYVTGTIRPRDT